MKKTIVTVSVVLALGIFGAFAVPVLAADPGGSAPVTEQRIGRCGRAILLSRLSSDPG